MGVCTDEGQDGGRDGCHEAEGRVYLVEIEIRTFTERSALHAQYRWTWVLGRVGHNWESMLMRLHKNERKRGVGERRVMERMRRAAVFLYHF